MLNHVTIHVKKNSYDFCLISKNLFNSLGLIEGNQYNIHFGQFIKNITIKPVDDINKIFLPKSVFCDLSINSNITLNIWTNDSDIFLGPIIGILINTKVLNKIKIGTCPDSFISNMYASEFNNCLSYYFSIEDLNWINKTIKGLIYSRNNNMWNEYILPFPNIIYDKGVRFDKNQKPIVSYIRKTFKNNCNINFINNTDYLDKWTLYDYLSKDVEIYNQMPKTIEYKSFNDTLKMLEKYGFIFIKSFYGSRGEEVLCVEKTNENYKVCYYKKTLVQKSFNNLSALQSFIKKFFKNRKTIVQEGIKTSMYKDLNLILRVLITKNISGDWINVSTLAILGENSIIINKYIEGYYYDYKDISYFLKNSNKVNYPSHKDVGDFAIRIAKYMEKHFGSLGELGIDIVVDNEGKLWFIEANSKPVKRVHLEYDKSLLFEYLPIFEYSIFLSSGGFTHE